MADNPSEPPASMAGNLISGTRAFIIWLGGSLAGIGAIFYTAGYLVTRAHLSLLGLYGLVDFGNDYLFQEGAKFFLVTGYALVRNVALPLLAVFGAVIVAAAILRLLLRARARRWWRSARERVPAFGADGWPRTLAFVALFVAFLGHSEAFLGKFQQPLCIANLLYANAGDEKCSAPMQRAADELRTALLNQDETLLGGAFQELLLGMALAAALAYATWRVTRPWRWRAWCVAPPLLAAALYLILLPMDYGVLQRPINYPRIALTLDEKAAFAMRGPVFLLNKTAGDFVVWDAPSRKLFWIPAGSVKRAEVDGAYDLFDSARPANPTHGERK